MTTVVSWQTDSISVSSENVFVELEVQAGFFYTIEVSAHSGRRDISARLLSGPGSGLLSWFDANEGGGSTWLSFQATTTGSVYVAPSFSWHGVGAFDVTLYEGAGLFPTAFDDVLHGSNARNWLRLLDGDDRYFGAGGIDVVHGDSGHDRLFGGAQRDLLFGDDGRDRLFGQNGSDYLDGGDGHDRIRGGNGRDTLYGGSGRDQLFGGASRDRLEGGEGADQLDGGRGNDRLKGGSGNDVFVFKGQFGQDIVQDFLFGSPLERIDLTAVSNIESYEDLVQNHLSTTEKGSLVFDDGAGNSITLNGVSLGDVGEENFLF